MSSSKLHWNIEKAIGTARLVPGLFKLPILCAYRESVSLHTTQKIETSTVNVYIAKAPYGNLGLLLLYPCDEGSLSPSKSFAVGRFRWRDITHRSIVGSDVHGSVDDNAIGL